MACAPTGSGKTLAFVLPILHHLKSPRSDGVRALCLAPTRELAEQVKVSFVVCLGVVSVLCHIQHLNLSAFQISFSCWSIFTIANFDPFGND